MRGGSGLRALLSQQEGEPVTAAAGSRLQVSPTSAPQEDTADHQQSSSAKVPFMLVFLFPIPPSPRRSALPGLQLLPASMP